MVIKSGSKKTDRTCGTPGGKLKINKKCWFGKTKRKGSLRRLKNRREDNIKMDFKVNGI
jgi:hypothetical protein